MDQGQGVPSRGLQERVARILALIDRALEDDEWSVAAASPRRATAEARRDP